MKKEYVKPVLFAESFSLSEHIASCVNIASFGAQENCRFDDQNGWVIFMTQDVCGEGPEYFTNQGLTPSIENVKDLGVECFNSFQDLNSVYFTS